MSARERMRTYPLDQLGIDPQDISKGAANTVRQLHEHGYETYIVGGAVRDLLLREHPKDFDIATAASPEQVREVFGRRARIIGRRFRLVQVRSGRELIEVSTFRAIPHAPRKTDAGRILDDNTWGSAEDDAYRRDLTANGLMLDPDRREVIDYVGGVPDLKSQRMSMIGDPQVRYQEDPVRMLRAVRFAAKLGFRMAPATARPLHSMAELLEHIPQSRLLDEIAKILRSSASKEAFALLARHGLLPVLLPHMASFDAAGREFIDLALAHNDRKQREEGGASVSFAVAAFFWPPIARSYKEARASGIDVTQFMELVDQSGLRECRLITRRVAQHAADLLLAMYRLETHCKTKRAASMFTSSRRLREFGKAMAFEELRVAAGEAESDVLDWWLGLAEADENERKELLESLPGRRSGRRKRTRRRAAAGD